MCGIILAESFDGLDVNEFVAQQYEAQKHRGSEGFGFFDRTRNRLRKATKERKILSQLKNTPSSSIMFHHRWPTSTDNVKNACHPFSTKDHFDTNYVLIHNGHIQNSKELRVEHEALGITYNSVQPDDGFNDSEALLWDVALTLEGKQDELKAYGNIAFIVLAMPRDKRKSTVLHFARNVQPLNMQLDETMILLASELDGEEIDSHKLYSYNYKSNKLTTKDFEVPNYAAFAPVPYRTAQGFPGVPSYNFNHQNEVLDDFWGDKYPENYGSNTKANQEYDQWLHPTYKDELLLIDGDDDYTWDGVMGEAVIETVFEDYNGNMVNVKSVIEDRIDSYMDASEGNYSQAAKLLKYDLEAYRQMLLDEPDNNEDLDLVLELDILTLAQYTLADCPLWFSEFSVDLKYEKPKVSQTELATSIKRVLAERLTGGLSCL